MKIYWHLSLSQCLYCFNNILSLYICSGIPGLSFLTFFNNFWQPKKWRNEKSSETVKFGRILPSKGKLCINHRDDFYTFINDFNLSSGSQTISYIFKCKLWLWNLLKSHVVAFTKIELLDLSRRALTYQHGQSPKQAPSLCSIGSIRPACLITRT